MDVMEVLSWFNGLENIKLSVKIENKNESYIVGYNKKRTKILTNISLQMCLK